MKLMMMVLMAAGLFTSGVALAQGEMDFDEEPAPRPKREKKQRAAKPKGEKKERAAKPKGEKPQVQLEEISVQGRIAKVETEKKGKKRASYELTTADGAKIKLPAIKAKKDEAPAINLDDHLDTDVTIVGQGTTSERKGKKQISLRTITSITPVGM